MLHLFRKNEELRIRKPMVSQTSRKYKIIPLTQYHYSAINEKLTLKFNYLVLFSIASGMIILCALFNYLSLFITRMRTRNREIELRKVCGSSIRNLFILFGTEYLFVLLLSGLLGMTFIELSLPKFRELSEINGNIYGESFLYFIGILFISYILLIPLLSADTTGNPAIYSYSVNAA